MKQADHCFGTSVVLLLKSPFRMPPGERLFRLVWLGAIGRAFVRFSARGVPTRASAKSAQFSARVAVGSAAGPMRAAVVPARPVAATTVDRLGELEQRVGALERWRDGA